MDRKDLYQFLKSNTYPGRGILIGRSEDDASLIILYFITGRSENSRNRVIEKTPDGIRTAAFDPAKLTDPSLVIYNPIRVYSGRTIVTNGNHTNTIYDYLASRRNFRDALLTLRFEPDPPIYTPRISGLVENDGSYTFSILKTAVGNPECCLRSFFGYSSAIPGLGHIICTYQGDGDPPPSFEGEPHPVSIAVADGLESFANSVWDALDADNKVSLYARQTVLETGESYDYIINKNQI